MNRNVSVGSASSHVRRAAERFKEWAALKSYVQKQKAQKTGIQVGVSAIFGLFLLVWAEIALYMALAASMKPYFAALLVLAFNLLIIGGVNLAIASWKRGVRHSEERVMLHQLYDGDDYSTHRAGEHRHGKKDDNSHENLSVSDAVLRAAKNRHEARLELMSARSELFDSTHAFVNEKIRMPLNRYVIQPVSRYRVPISFAGSFLVGLLAARALMPKREIELIEISEVPVTNDIRSDDFYSKP